MGEVEKEVVWRRVESGPDHKPSRVSRLAANKTSKRHEITVRSPGRKPPSVSPSEATGRKSSLGLSLPVEFAAAPPGTSSLVFLFLLLLLFLLLSSVVMRVWLVTKQLAAPVLLF